MTSIHLEIPYKTINQWLKDRGGLPKDWQQKLKAIEIKIQQLKIIG